MSIEVKVVRVPGKVVDVFLEDGANVADALDAADMYVEEGEKVTVNGNDASNSTSLKTGDRVIVAKGAKGAEAA